MSHADQLEPTAKLRWVRNGKQYTLQQWWSNEVNVKMGPAHMVKGEWRDVPMEEDQ